MADNKTQPGKASVGAFVAQIPDEARRADAKALVKLMKAVSGKPAVLWGPSIIGFGSRHYRYESGREGDMPVVAFSPRKAATVVYGVTGARGADALLKRLGRHALGKGCLYIKRLDDIDLAVLERLVANACAARSGA